MAILSLSLLFAGVAVAHMGIKTIVIDGVMYVSNALDKSIYLTGF